jgi:hypothetical protein
VHISCLGLPAVTQARMHLAPHFFHLAVEDLYHSGVRTTFLGSSHYQPSSHEKQTPTSRERMVINRCPSMSRVLPRASIVTLSRSGATQC